MDETLSVTDLWSLGIGGSNVAAHPGRIQSLPQGPPPAAVEEALSWMREALSPGYQGNRRFLFFVGGPGGGKSHAAATLVADLRPLTDDSDGLAHRSYRYDSPGGELLLINDATIPSGAARGGTLADDLSNATSTHTVSCVNRGVLVDESHREVKKGYGHVVTAWLRNDATHRTHEHWQLIAHDSPDKEAAYLKQAVLHSESESIELLAIFVDVCSLVEKRPRVDVSNGSLRASPYEISIFDPRSSSRRDTPAGTLLDIVVDQLCWEERGELDPIAANLQSLSSASTREGLLSILRAAELGSSQRFAYRQLWGFFARAIAGPLPEELNRDRLGEWIDSRQPGGGDGARAVFDSIRSLARARLHEALFGDDWASSIRHPILGSTTRIDPSRDMRPGHPNDATAGWATPVSAAFLGAEVGAPPLLGLRDAAESSVLDAYITEFDEALDDAFVEAIRDANDVAWRSSATSWYGRYLTRMLAVAHGYPAFTEELKDWTFAWQMSPNLQKGLKEDLQALLRPSRQGGPRTSYIPMFASRAEPVVGTPAAPTLVVELNELQLRTSKDGERLVLKVDRGHTELGEVALDLSMMREASASCSGWLGLTDSMESVVPRLERFRSMNLIPGKLDHNSLRVITRDGTFSVSAVPRERVEK